MPLEHRREAGPTARVFIVDDDSSVLRGLERLFRSFGWHVETFNSALTFLERVWHDVPSCLVLDLRLRELTGLDVQERLAAMGEDLPIVFISGMGDVASAACAMRRGAVDFLVKPTDQIELMSAVERALTRDVEARRSRQAQNLARERLTRLTPREQEICRFVAEGWLNKQIAAELGSSEKTIKVHRARMMRKLDVQSVAALVRLLHLPALNPHNRRS